MPQEYKEIVQKPKQYSSKAAFIENKHLAEEYQGRSYATEKQREAQDQSMAELEEEKAKLEKEKESMDWSKGISILKQAPVTSFTAAATGKQWELKGQEQVVDEEDLDKLCNFINSKKQSTLFSNQFVQQAEPETQHHDFGYQASQSYPSATC